MKYHLYFSQGQKKKYWSNRETLLLTCTHFFSAIQKNYLIKRLFCPLQISLLYGYSSVPYQVQVVLFPQNKNFGFISEVTTLTHEIFLNTTKNEKKKLIKKKKKKGIILSTYECLLSIFWTTEPDNIISQIQLGNFYLDEIYPIFESDLKPFSKL